MTETEQQAAEIEALAGQEASQEQEFIPNENGGIGEQIRSMSTGDMMTGLLITTFGLLTKLRGQHWALPPDVLEEAGQEYGNCIDHYAPNYKAAPWVGAAGMTAFIFAPPLMEEIRLRNEREQRTEAQANAEQGTKHGD